MAPAPAFRALKVTLQEDGVGHIQLHRPRVANAFDNTITEELPQAAEWLEGEGARVILLSGAGRNFCGGIDLGSLQGGILAASGGCGARDAYAFRKSLGALQDAVTSLERVRCPTIALVHGACYGAGVDLITACDMRFSTADARFCVKEVDLAIVADMGSLQRLPSIVGHAHAMDLSLTARMIDGTEAKALGLVSAALPDQDALMRHGAGVAQAIAAKSPAAVAGTKAVLLYQRDHSVEEGLDYVMVWNAGMLLRSTDLTEAMTAMKQKRKPAFSKL